MRFLVYRSSQGSVSKEPPCKGAVRGPESAAWPGEYVWFLDLNTLEELLGYLNAVGGGLGVFAAEEDEEHPAIEIFEEEAGDED